MLSMPLVTVLRRQRNCGHEWRKSSVVNTTVLLIPILTLPKVFYGCLTFFDDKGPQFQATPSKTVGFVAHIFVPGSIGVERKITWQ